jgi:inward rectifier potassium channel
MILPITMEKLSFFQNFDDMFSNNVAIGLPILLMRVIYGAKFESMYTRSVDNSKTILNLDKLNSYDIVTLE